MTIRLHSGLFPVCQEITSDTIEEVHDFLIHGIAGRLFRQENNSHSDKHFRNNLGSKY